MKETDDGKRVGVLDVGSIPTTSTKTLVGRNVHGVVERLQVLTNEHGGDLDSTGRIEILQEDSDTQYKRQ